MRADLDELMTERGLDALLVTIGEQPSANSLYMTNGAELTGGWVIKRRDRPALLYHYGMEAGGAAKSGLVTRNLSQFNYRQILQEMDNDRLRAATRLLDLVLQDAGVTGRVAVYGTGEVGAFHALLNALVETRPDLEIVGEFHRNVLLVARETKDEREIDHIRDVGRRTQEVVAAVVEYLRRQQLRDDVLVDDAEEPITVGRVKRFIRRELLDRDLFDPDGTIFSTGRDAGVPHNSGEADEVLRLGLPIVLDIYPRDLRTGYYFDMTRTWVLGEAPDELQSAYDDVMAAFDAAMTALQPGGDVADIQHVVCDLFEGRGHPTPRTDPTGDIGYCHSLGHGIGLDVHEAPHLSDMSKEVLRPGTVITIEPGLYYPERALGVRIEDTVAVLPDGSIESLTGFSKDLVIPIRPDQPRLMPAEHPLLED